MNDCCNHGKNDVQYVGQKIKHLNFLVNSLKNNVHLTKK